MAIKKVAFDVCQKLESVEEAEEKREEGAEERYDGPPPPIPGYDSQK